MNKEKKLIINYISWFLFLFIIVFVGVNKVFGVTLPTYTDIGYVTNDTTLLASADYLSSPIDVPAGASYQLEQVRQITLQVGNQNIIPNRHYQLEIALYQQVRLTNANVYVVSNGQNVECLVNYDYSSFAGQYPRWNFSCPVSSNYFTISLTNSSNEYLFEPGIFSWGNAILRYTDSPITDNGINDIINNQNQNTQDIINNQNNIFKNCRNSYNLVNPNVGVTNQLTIQSNGTGILNGTVSNNFAINFGTMSLKRGISYRFNSNLTGSLNGSYFLTSDNNSFIYLNNSQPFTVSQDAIYNLSMIIISGTYNNVTFKPMINEGTVSLPFESYGVQVCTNKLDEQTNAINGLNDSINDETGPNTSGLSNVAGWLPPGPVDSILTLPLTFLNSLNNAIGGSCSAVNVNLPFVNKTLNIPCFTTFMSQYLPNFNTLYTWIGGIVSVYILFNYLLSLYKWVDDTLSLRENTMPGYFDDRFGGGA